MPDQITHAVEQPAATPPAQLLSTADLRHQKRIALMQKLFAHAFQSHLQPEPSEKNDEPTYFDQLITTLPEIDTLIQEHAPERPLNDINKVDLAILRMIVFESKRKKTPKKVLINEAVELAKHFGTESSPRFVNGVLAQILLPESSPAASATS